MPLDIKLGIVTQWAETISGFVLRRRKAQQDDRIQAIA
ncbi:hypothetical protein X762_12290 [Mesorhizobium sp. LSHC426A00]|nr:hypothetical protein X762_12290 [Mesorhizobium sp. LSHC426A00]ESX56251.1 hypothetical protein X761_12690 [Mesorhizobium sp. LSHC424B00]ESX73098.1 hypothetical protein X758_12020 [Mesorhizobium sp. LSHC416B00]